MTSFKIGARVQSKSHGLGTVIGTIRNGMFLVQHDNQPKDKGHNGFDYEMVEGSLPSSHVTNCWYFFDWQITHAPVVPVAAAQKTNRDKILAHLLAGKSITQLEAFGVYRIFRLAARIHELKSKGHKIKTTLKMDETGKQYGEYSLITQARA